MLPCSIWLSSFYEIEQFQNNLDYSVPKVLMRFLFMGRFHNIILAFIEQPYIKETKQVPNYQDVRLINESENSGPGMIKITKDIYDIFVSHDSAQHPNVLETIEFAGDELTDERAFSA